MIVVVRVSNLSVVARRPVRWSELLDIGCRGNANEAGKSEVSHLFISSCASVLISQINFNLVVFLIGPNGKNSKTEDTGYENGIQASTLFKKIQNR